MTTFEKIKIIANKRGISLKKLGPKAGLSENTIYSWQKKSPGIKSLEKVAKALNVPVSRIVDDDNNTSRKSVDLEDESTIMTFEGKPIPDKYKEMFKDILRRMENE